jgi:PKD repeat protein
VPILLVGRRGKEYWGMLYTARSAGRPSRVFDGRVARRLFTMFAVVVVVSVGLFPAPARAIVAETPLSTDGPDHPVGTEGRVNAIAVVDGVAYIGGDFTTVGGSPRSNLAAIDLTTGNVTDWNPGADGVVHAVTASPDGLVIYVGGTFATVDDRTRRRLAAVDARTGATTGWNPNPSAMVESIDVDGSDVYIAGNFQSVGSVDVRYAAKVSAVTADADPAWDPDPAAPVNAIDVAPDGDTVYLGGSFGRVGGSVRQNAAAIDAATGDVTPWNPDVPHVVIDLEVGLDSSIVYFAIGGPWADGGNLASAVSASNGATVWSHQSDGDVQAVAVAPDRVYFGGHFYLSGGVPFNKLVSYNPTSGQRDNGWAPGADSAFGVWALTYAGGRLFVGGDFRVIGGAVQPHFAVFPGVGGNQAPGAAFDWVCDGLTCTFDSSSSGDTDGFIVDRVWDFGDGGSDRGTPAEHTYDLPGTYTVELTVTDDDGATTTTARQVDTGNLSPAASITISCDYLECLFDGTGSSDPDGIIVDYRWGIEGTPDPAAPTATHVYESPGTYLVELTVTDDDGAAASSAVEVTVTAPPVHVHNLAPFPRDRDAWKWIAVVQVTVRTAGEDPVVGAVVEGYFGQGREASCTTGTNGKCKVKVRVKDSKKRIPWTMTNITAPGIYESTANHDAAKDDSNGTVILVWQP